MSISNGLLNFRPFIATPPPAAGLRRILIVENGEAMAAALTPVISRKMGLTVESVSGENFNKRIQQGSSDILLTLLDLDSAAATREAAMELAFSVELPVVLYSCQECLEDRIMLRNRNNIVDNVHISDLQPPETLAEICRRIQANQGVTLLVVDDASIMRLVLQRTLETYRFRVLLASDGVEALQILEERPEITLVITDYQMPRMDGFELISRIRRRRSRNELAIIGISAIDEDGLSAQFLKRGANDFLNKPFNRDEFYCRLSQNLEMLELVKALRDASERDFLTGLHNRRYFMDSARRIHALLGRDLGNATLAMIDIDHFKLVNDNHNHDVGDEALKHVASLILARFRKTDIVSRYGGEEFCVFAPSMMKVQANDVFDSLRRTIETTPLKSVSGAVLHLTVSIGVACELERSLEDMIARADTRLYIAKRSGRNRIILNDA